MRRSASAALLLVLGFSAPASAKEVIRINRRWDILDPVGRTPAAIRRGLREAARRLGAFTFELAGVEVGAPLLLEVAGSKAQHPTRGLRERLLQAVDPRDFVLLVDDLLRAKRHGLEDAVIPSGRARMAGILLHPDDVFSKAPRLYARRSRRLSVEEPPHDPVPHVPPWTLLGSIWTAAYPQPETEAEHLAALAEHNRGLVDRLNHLFAQLRRQGATVEINASVRRRERGYLIYGAYILSRSRTARQVARRLRGLARLQGAAGLRVPIRWSHPAGWRATVRAARKMADAYGVVYATRRGALHSDHYDGRAVDFSVTGLPPALELESYDGRRRSTFDLSDPAEPRDLNLTPRLIAWVEEAYGIEKLKTDYPHWTDSY